MPESASVAKQPTIEMRRTPGALRALGDVFKKLLRRPAGVAGLVIIFAILLIAIFADVVATHDPLDTEPTNAFANPSMGNLLGTDNLGRDTFSRIVHGSRTALFVGLISVGIGCLVGIPIGLYSGYFGGWHDETSMRAMDALYAFPAILLALVVIAAIGPGMVNVSIAIGATFVPAFARIVRGSTLSIVSQDFITAATAMGAGSTRILLRHVLPNVMAPVIVQVSLGLAFAIIAEASLSYLGLGAQPPEPSWGLMLQSAQRFIHSNVTLAVYPGLTIVIVVLAWNLLGDALRDVLDPRLRHR